MTAVASSANPPQPMMSNNTATANNNNHGGQISHSGSSSNINTSGGTSGSSNHHHHHHMMYNNHHHHHHHPSTTANNNSNNNNNSMIQQQSRAHTPQVHGLQPQHYTFGNHNAGQHQQQQRTHMGSNSNTTQYPGGGYNHHHQLVGSTTSTVGMNSQNPYPSHGHHQQQQQHLSSSNANNMVIHPSSQNMFNNLMHQQYNNNNNYSQAPNNYNPQQQHNLILTTSTSNTNNNNNMPPSMNHSPSNNNMVVDSMINSPIPSSKQSLPSSSAAGAENENIFSINSFFRHANNDVRSTSAPTNPFLVQNSTSSSTPAGTAFTTTTTMVNLQNNTNQPKWSQVLTQSELGPPNQQQQPTSTVSTNQQPQQQQNNEQEEETDGKDPNGTKGGIKITRNIRADICVTPTEPVEYPKHGVLYVYNVENWSDKNSFYDKIAYSFGTPSTQKKVHCSYLNCKVMHYERTCQGVYYCPHKDDEGNSCIVRPCRLRFHTCQKHNNNSLTKSGKCPFKLHFYVPLDKSDHRRLLLCLGTHNHPLLSETDCMIVSSQATEKKAKQAKVSINQQSFQANPQEPSAKSSTQNASSSSQDQNQSMMRVSSSSSMQSSKQSSKLKSTKPNMNTNMNMGSALPDTISTTHNNIVGYNPNFPTTMVNNNSMMNGIPISINSNTMQNVIPPLTTNMSSSNMPPHIMTSNSMQSTTAAATTAMNNIPMPNQNTLINNMAPQNSMIPQNLIMGTGMNRSIHHMNSNNTGGICGSSISSSSVGGVGGGILSHSNTALQQHYPMSPPPKTPTNIPQLHHSTIPRSASQELLIGSTGLTPTHSSPLGRSPNLSPPYSYSSPHNVPSGLPMHPSVTPPPPTSISSISTIGTGIPAAKKLTSLFQPNDYLQHVSKPPSYSKTGDQHPESRKPTSTTTSSLMSSSPNFMSSSSPSLYSYSNSPSPRVELTRSPPYSHTNPITPSPPHMLVSPMNPGFPSLSPSYFCDNTFPSPLNTYSSPQQHHQTTLPISQSPSQIIYKTDAPPPPGSTAGIKRERVYISADNSSKKVKQEEDSVLPPIGSIVD